jgi:glutathione S-transferase
MKLMGTTNMEAAQILGVSEHLREMMLAFRALVSYGEDATSEAADQWFDSGSTDVSGTADSSKRSTRYLQWWMGRIENSLGSYGFAVGDKLSLADILLYYYFAEMMTDAEAPDEFPQYKRVPFGNKERIDVALARYPKISASIGAVQGNANFQKWLSIRGPQGF